MQDLRVEILDTLDRLQAAEWNRLAGTGNPFVRHEFLTALERRDCLGERYGWLPRHLSVRNEWGRLVGAAPLYLKDNSYGELVFDWSWADAYRRAGLSYYPKLVSAVPYSPVTGPRLLIDPDASAEPVARTLIAASLELAEREAASSVHWLFPSGDQAQRLERAGHARRVGCQFHWHNPGYRDFQDFLDTLTSERRKKIRRERRKVAESGVDFRLLNGPNAASADWELFYALYASTFHRRGGVPTLSVDFFDEIARTLGDQVLLVQAEHRGEVVAAAYCLVGDDSLYGRHWGCLHAYDSLHFEACYYQGIDFCIRRGLLRFEPGAQGEHKIWRGFLPHYTWSNHWIRHPGFRRAIERFLRQETEDMDDYVRELSEHSPYKATD